MAGGRNSYNEIDGNWTVVPERVDGFREKLEELGVSLDG